MLKEDFYSKFSEKSWSISGLKINFCESSVIKIILGREYGNRLENVKVYAPTLVTKIILPNPIFSVKK